MVKLNELTLGHLYRFQELAGKPITDLDATGVKDLGLLLYIMGGEPEGQAVHQYLNQFRVSDIKALASEVKGAIASNPLASVPKASEAAGTE